MEEQNQQVEESTSVEEPILVEVSPTAGFTGRLRIREGQHVFINGVPFHVDRVGPMRIVLSVEPKVTRSVANGVMQVP